MSGHPKTHDCAATGCAIRLPAHVLMCRPHWGLVPRPLQTEIWKHYRPGQTAATASTQYLQAVLVAVKALPPGPVKPARRTADLVNECLITGCGRNLPARVLVCRSHWRLLPYPIRQNLLGLRTAPGHKPSLERVRQAAEAATAAVRQAAAETPRTQGEHSA